MKKTNHNIRCRQLQIRQDVMHDRPFTRVGYSLTYFGESLYKMAAGYASCFTSQQTIGKTYRTRRALPNFSYSIFNQSLNQKIHLIIKRDESTIPNRFEEIGECLSFRTIGIMSI